MVQLQQGQCGLCAHFGASHSNEPQIIQIRLKGEAPESMHETCGHPQHKPLNLTVNPTSGCAGFAPAS